MDLRIVVVVAMEVVSGLCLQPRWRLVLLVLIRGREMLDLDFKVHTKYFSLLVHVLTAYLYTIMNKASETNHAYYIVPCKIRNSPKFHIFHSSQ